MILNVSLIRRLLRGPIALWAIGLACLFAVARPATAKITIGYELNLETGYAVGDRARSGDGLSLYNWGLRYSRMQIRYLSDDNRFWSDADIYLYSRDHHNSFKTLYFGAGYRGDYWELSFGQLLSPTWLTGPCQVLLDALALEGYGNADLNSTEQIRLTLGRRHKLLISVEAPYHDGRGVWSGGLVYHSLPGGSLTAKVDLSRVSLEPWFHGEQIRFRDDRGGDDYWSLDLGLDFTARIGPVTFSGGISAARNTSQENPVVTADPAVVNNRVVGDATQVGVWAELALADLRFGYGRAWADRVDWPETAHRQAVYINYALSFGPLTFTPEVLWLDHGQDGAGADQGQTTYIGLWSSIKF